MTAFSWRVNFDVFFFAAFFHTSPAQLSRVLVGPDLPGRVPLQRLRHLRRHTDVPVPRDARVPMGVH